MRGPDVRRLQQATNTRLRARDQHEYVCAEDGVYGRESARAVRRAAYLLGFGLKITRPLKRRGEIGEDAQRLIRNPDERNAGQIKAAEKRMARERKRLAKIAKRNHGRAGCIRFCRKWTGVRENPAGSNKGGKITEWQMALGAWLVGLAWCGVFCAAALRAAGVKLGSAPWRLASVAFIEDDARAGRGPFKRWTTSAAGVQPGDLVVLFGRGVHVAVVEAITPAGVKTREGNTSASNAGSQSNGGMVAARTRPFSDVHGYAIVNYG